MLEVLVDVNRNDDRSSQRDKSRVKNDQAKNDQEDSQQGNKTE